MDQVWALGTAVCVTFQSKKQHVDNFLEIMMEYMTVFSTVQFLKLFSRETDGSLCHRADLLVNLEAKSYNEVGFGSSCCHIQNADYTLLYVCQKKMDIMRTVS